jgi:hypothetical protein
MTTDAGTLASQIMEADIRFFHEAFSQWLDDPGITLACGRWSDGAILELIPQGHAAILPAAYDGCFAGVRELRLQGVPHHMHIDLGRIHKLSFAVAPSVCLEFKPSFEVRLLLLGPGGAPTSTWMVSLMLSTPYTRGALDKRSVLAFFRRAKQQANLRPDLVEMQIDPAVQSSALGSEILERKRSTNPRLASSI